MTKALRLKIYRKCEGHCAYCGCKIKYKDMQVDHIRARRRDGENCPENYLPACRSCNQSKSTYTVEEFRKRLVDDVARLHRDSAKLRILMRFGIIKKVKSEVVFYFELKMKDG